MIHMGKFDDLGINDNDVNLSFKNLITNFNIKKINKFG